MQSGRILYCHHFNWTPLLSHKAHSQSTAPLLAAAITSAARGVGYHQDHEGKGWAIDEKDVEADILALREMGANSIRLTHYQHGQPVHDLADRYGMVLWDEIPLVSAWTLGGAPQATAQLLDNARQQLPYFCNRYVAPIRAFGPENPGS